MVPLLSATGFLALYACAMGAGGAVAWWAETRGGGSCAPARGAVSSFLLGTGLAPFLLGTTLGAMLFAAPGLPFPCYGAALVVLYAAATALGHRALAGALRATYTAFREPGPPGTDARRRIGLAVLVAGFLAVTVFAASSALRPVRDHDSTVYALDARRVAQRSSLEALLSRIPGPDHQISNHNHGASYQLYLASALAFGPDPKQDFPLRLAQQVCGLHVLVLLSAAGLQAGAAAAALAPLLLLLSCSWGYTLSASSRDPYPVAALVLVMLWGVRWMKTGAGRNLGMLLAAFVFLWNSHASSLVLAPTAAAAIILCGRGTRPRLAVAFVAAAGAVLGGSALAAAFLRTGDPTAESFDYYRMLAGTPALETVLAARGTPPPGLAGLPSRLARLWTDGPLLFGLVGAALVARAGLCARAGGNRPSPVPGDARVAPTCLTMAALLVLQAAGGFDAIDPRISELMATNVRYRLPLQIVTALLGGYLLGDLLTRTLRRPTSTARCGLALVLLLAAGLWTMRFHWQLARRPEVCLDGREGGAVLAQQQSDFWFLSALRQMPRDRTILAAPPYYAWYYTENQVISLYDVRLRPAFLAVDPADAVAVLDRLGIEYLCLAAGEIDTLRPLAFGRALAPPMFQPLGQVERWWFFRRHRPQ